MEQQWDAFFFSRGVKESKGTWYKKHPKNHSYSNHQFSGAKLVCGECKLLLKRGLQRCAGIKEAHRWELRKIARRGYWFQACFFGWVAHPSSSLFYIKEHKPHSLGKNGVPHHFRFRNPKTNTNNKQTHLHHEKKHTKRPITPLPIWGRFPPLRFLLLLRHSWRHQPSHNINPGLWVSFCCGFVWISTAPIGCRLPGVFVVSASRLGNPLPTAERFVIPVGEGCEATRHRTPGAQWLGPPRGAWNFSLKAQQPNSKVPGSVSKGGEAGDSFRQNSWRRLEGTHEP